MIHGRPYTDSRPQAPFFDPPEASHECSVRECPDASWDLEEFQKCEVCRKRYCPEHIKTFSDLHFCRDCRMCSCRAIAVALCADCGSLTCSMCSRPDGLGGRLCSECKHNPDPDDAPSEAYDADDFRDQVCA